MADFTLKKYKVLLGTLISKGYTFRTFEEIMTKDPVKSVTIRHDVDKYPMKALKMAEIEKKMGVCSSYHFRIVGRLKTPEIYRKIIEMGHEIAYHYEDLTMASRNSKTISFNNEIFNNAYVSFRKNLSYLRELYPVKVISMHGDPIHALDNRILWDHFNYRNDGILCEVYLDIDYSKVLYITDTGRSWNTSSANIRDKVSSGSGSTASEPLDVKYNFRATNDIIKAILSERLPYQIIINIHPQRWAADPVHWLEELILQNIKNLIKPLLRLKQTSDKII